MLTNGARAGQPWARVGVVNLKKLKYVDAVSDSRIQRCRWGGALPQDGGARCHTFFPCPLDQALAAAASGPDSGVARASHHLAKFLTVEAQAKFGTPGSVFFAPAFQACGAFLFRTV